MGSMNDRPVANMGGQRTGSPCMPQENFDFLFTRAPRSSQLLSTKFLLNWKNQDAVNSIKQNEGCNCVSDGASLNQCNTDKVHKLSISALQETVRFRNKLKAYIDYKTKFVCS